MTRIGIGIVIGVALTCAGGIASRANQNSYAIGAMQSRIETLEAVAKKVPGLELQAFAFKRDIAILKVELDKQKRSP